jgi:hypothetical protein
MTPKEKAKQLVDSFYQLFPLDKDVNITDGELNWKYNDWNQSKKAALIAVEEMLDFRNGLYINEDSLAHQYLIEVKHEIEQL